ncbi:MAG: hypothetical protein L0H65_13870, partial [Pseudorhodobacter sp.]|nr:hypothetical protein [Pseudorhodobacter sp.]
MRRPASPVAAAPETPEKPQTYVLWFDEAEDIRRTTLQELQAKGHRILGVIYPGPINPVTSPLGSAETGVTSFMLLPIGPGANLAETTELHDLKILPDDLAPAAHEHSAPGVLFVNRDASGDALETLPKGYVFDTTGLDLPLAKIIALLRVKTFILPPNINRREALRHCSSVVTQDALLATLAVLIGRNVMVPEAAFSPVEPIQQAFRSGKAALENLMRNSTRFVDVKTHQKIDIATVRRRIDEQFLPVATGEVRLPDLETDQPLCIVIGTAERVIDPPAQLFQGRKTAQAPPDFAPRTLSQNPDTLGGQDFIVWVGMPSTDWVRNSSGVVRILSRYPCGIPMHIGHETGFSPVLACDRVCGLTDPETGDYIVQYDLAADIDQLDAKARRRFRSLGRQILPDLRRLQSTWHVNRHDVFTLTRRLGLQTHPRLLILGSEPAKKGLPIRTNPWNIADTDLIHRLLADHPEAEILYQPHGGTAADNAFLASIQQVSGRVRILDADLDPAELAPVVDEFHTVASSLGIAALMTQKPVTVYGRPAYAGLGLTRDLDLDGQERPLLVETALDTACFMGWYFTENAVFVDPITGQRAPCEGFAKDWFPGCGDLRDSIADRLLARLEHDQSIKSRDDTLSVLRSHVKLDHVRALLDTINLPTEIDERPDMALTIAEAYAGLGNWRKALQIASNVQRQHKAAMTTKVAQSISRIRARIRSTEDRAAFGHCLLSEFRNTAAAEMEKIGTALMKRRYFGTALIVFRSIPPSNALLAAICRCQTGKSDLEGAQRTITELVARRAPEAEIEILSLGLHESGGNWPEAMTILTRLCDKAANDLDLRQRYANACAEAGELDLAQEAYQSLIPTVKGPAAAQ